MDHQGSGRPRSSADTHGQAAWSWLESGEEPEDPPSQAPGGSKPAGRRGSGGQQDLGRGSGAQRRLGPPTAPQRMTGTGPYPAAVTGAYSAVATGTQPAAGTGGYPVAGIGARPVAGTGARPVAGTGARLAAGTGPYPVPGDLTSPGAHDPTPPGGFSPGGFSPGGFSPGRGPAQGDGLVDDATDPNLARADILGSPPAAMTGPGRRHSTKPGRVTAGSARAEPGSAKADDGRGSWTRRLGSRASLMAAAAVVVVAGAGFAGYKYLYEARVNAPVSPTLRLPTTAPISAGLNQALGKWQHIGSRTSDPEPLTLEGLYPPQFVLNGSSYVRTAASVTKNCQAAVYGGNLQAALQSGHCSQVARASYVSGNNQMMGTVGVINLSTSAAASKAGAATGPQEIIVPLAAKKGVTAKLGHGTGVVQAEIKGHYLILMWAEFTNLKSPPNSAARAQLEQFATNLVTGTANINLSTRMLSGKA
jgi:hypothetical protein